MLDGDASTQSGLKLVLYDCKRTLRHDCTTTSPTRPDAAQASSVQYRGTCMPRPTLRNSEWRPLTALTSESELQTSIRRGDVTDRLGGGSRGKGQVSDVIETREPWRWEVQTRLPLSSSSVLVSAVFRTNYSVSVSTARAWCEALGWTEVSLAATESVVETSGAACFSTASFHGPSLLLGNDLVELGCKPSGVIMV
ncbi:hypothetical protein SPBR_01014 [Sporothrix brasiliensis 5110]|uniref:Uncharacterized protein n=1 Tax=Sporothrix brasiliensis 5110 TaxID=1398154 RepID=A0A0C2IXQ8_9PEZI|nr:uncharacterized protein SPBR_01014 [Sporothrix brasiliensis 5110]KIH89827.1 hypothetical protein SPBR_01014 [Sporothrix brasiliensis 5110]